MESALRLLVRRHLGLPGENVGHQGGEILVFEVGGRRFGLPASDVGELVRVVAIAPLPMAPAHLEGVINFRGQVVPVHDLRARLGLPAKEVEPSDHLIITRSRESPIALRIDRAVELVRLDATDVEGAGGVAKLADGLAPLLDLDALIARDPPRGSEREPREAPGVSR